jgi:hypothetical protein
MTKTKLESLKKMIDELNFKLLHGCSTNFIHDGQDMSTREVECYLVGQRNALFNLYMDLKGNEKD